MRLKQWHRTTRRWFGHALGPVFGTTQARGSLAALQPNSILVVRLNNRLGNTVLLSPLLIALAQRYPTARIDVLLRNPNAAELLRGLPGIGTVWTLDRRTLKLPWRAVGLLLRIRSQRYDLLIDPAEQSSSNRIAALSLRAKTRLGFAAPHQWLSLDVAVLRPAHAKHEGLYPLLLLGIDAPMDGSHRVQIKLPATQQGDRKSVV